MDYENETAQQNQQDLIMISQAYESLRDNGLDLTGAIGECVDNAYEAQASEIAVFTKKSKVSIGGKKPQNRVVEFAVADNGIGMNDQILKSSLRFGDSARDDSVIGRQIGKYGVGAVEAGISQGRRIEVYSRFKKEDGSLSDWRMVFIDLNEIHEGDMRRIPEPIPALPPEAYLPEWLRNSSGTVFVVKNCDRVKTDEALPTDLGRIYRKAIEFDGISITFNGNKVYVQDPLYLSRETKIDYELEENGEKAETKAEVIDSESYEFEIPNSNGATACVTVKITLVDKRYRSKVGMGGNPWAKAHKIPKNQGISILREGREVYYGPCIDIVGRGQKEDDRWWGLEIDVPSSLDYLMNMQHIKNKIQPGEQLVDRIAPDVQRTLKTIMKRIAHDRSQAKVEEAKEQGKYSTAEETMAKAVVKKTPGKSEAELEEYLEGLVDKIAPDASSKEKREAVRKELARKPYSINEVQFPGKKLFHAEPLMQNIILNLNISHPFMKVCQAYNDELEAEGIDSSVISDINNARALLFSAYVKAIEITKDYYKGSVDEGILEDILERVEAEWGTVLSTFISKSNLKGAN